MNHMDGQEKFLFELNTAVEIVAQGTDETRVKLFAENNFGDFIIEIRRPSKREKTELKLGINSQNARFN